MKGKFDFKALMLEHGEKIGLGVVGLVVIYCLVTALGRSPIGEKMEPADIIAECGVAETAIRDSDLPPGASLPDFLTQYAAASKPVAVDTFPRLEIVKSLFPPQKTRPDPQLFPPDGLRATAGYGALALKPPDGEGRRKSDELLIDVPGKRKFGGVDAPEGARTEGRSWVVLTAGIPLVLQDNAYRQALADVEHSDPKKDRVVYLPPFDGASMSSLVAGNALIERAEVIEGAKDNWQPLPTEVVVAGLVADKRWVDTGKTKIVPDKYHDPNKIHTAPLPPLLLEDWTAEEVGHPLIPVTAAAKDDVKKKEPGAKEDASPFPFGTSPAPKSASPSPKRQAATGPAEHLLFRFFDFSVEQGKTYKYRVRLFVKNINYEVEPGHLADEKSAEVFGRATPLSNETDPVTVPVAGAVLAGGIDPPNDKKDQPQPRGRMMVVDWNSSTGVEKVKWFSRRIGHRAVFPHPQDVADDESDDTFFEWKRIRSREVEWVKYIIPATGAKRTEPPRGQWGDDWRIVGNVKVLDPVRKKLRIEHRFNSDHMLADLRGEGGAGGELLVVDGSGRLIVRNAARDAAEFERRRQFFEGAPGEAPKAAQPSRKGKDDEFHNKPQ